MGSITPSGELVLTIQVRCVTPHRIQVGNEMCLKGGRAGCRRNQVQQVLKGVVCSLGARCVRRENDGRGEKSRTCASC